MAQTKEGAQKALKTILANNPNHFKDAGRIGGAAPHKTRGGFGALGKELHKKVSAKGGRAGRLK